MVAPLSVESDHHDADLYVQSFRIFELLFTVLNKQRTLIRCSDCLLCVSLASCLSV